MFNFEGALLRSRRFYALPTLEDTTEDFLTGELNGYVLDGKIIGPAIG